MSCGKEQCCKNKAAEPDYLVCTCMGVMRSEIIEAIHQGATSFKALSDLLGVGTGCTSCVPEVEQLLEEYAKKQ